MPRIQLRHLMLAIAGFGVALFLIRKIPGETMTAFVCLLLASLFWLPTHGRPWVAVRAFFLAAILLNVVLFLFVMYSPIDWVGMILFFSAFTLSLATLGFGLAWVLCVKGQQRAWRALVVAGSLGLALSMWMTRWPMKLGFALSSPALNRLADHVEAGGRVVPGEWAGLYRIQESVPWDGDTALVIAYSQGGMAAFVRRRGSARGATMDQLSERGRWGYLYQD